MRASEDNPKDRPSSTGTARDDDVSPDGVGDSAESQNVANAGNRCSSSNDSPPLPSLPLRKIKLWALRVANSVRGQSAVGSSTRQTLRCQNNPRGPPLSVDTSFWKFHSHPATSATSNVESEYELPARPKNAIIKPQRVPPCTQPTFFRAPEVISYECCSTEQGHRTQPESRIMGFSKTQRIAILLAIDGVFFIIELVVGYAVHSLALVADAFHMLNDVLSLVVGLWAVKRAKTGRTTNYTYGWQRAETLGALFNGVFLIALCLSIFLQAIERFVEPRVVSNPVLVLIVGCLGLASNIMGLFLFHDHGHSHGHGEEEHDHGHSHSHNPIRNAEEGHSHNTEHVQWADETTRLIGDQRGSIEDVLPSVRVAGFQGSSERRGFSKSDESNATVSNHEGTSAYRRRSTSHADNRHRRRTSFFTGTIDDMPIHPAGRRDEIINASHLDEDQSDAGTDDAVDTTEADSHNKKTTNGSAGGYGSVQPSANHEYSHAAHKHRQPKDQKKGGGGHGHSHDDLNMRGVFLHVLGDALGNVGVIASALIIWLTTFPGRYYFDPAISLLIAFIILYSAIPLCKAAARILLQAVPMGMSIDEIRADIEDLKGINSAHHIHVWQLSDTKLVASLHVRISSEIKDAGTEGYMRLAREIQQCLKEYGIRSSTIQPEFEWDSLDERQRANGKATAHDSPNPSPGSSSRRVLLSKDQDPDAKECMLDCEDAGEVVENLQRSESHAHDHNHDHDHDHDSHDHAHDHSNGKNKHNHNHQH